ncbi:LysR family transcriptional regulator [Paraburkholderia sp. BL8N3]|jgi:LysR family glycine cleavage system transcriptional activator|nr:LysR substrate-binding domain-containing protein [Paraburkholderia sp. BL8N3]TCK39389.1 LysR family transcriptional regulator [Paraburkholderia sp. BL8N3]
MPAYPPLKALIAMEAAMRLGSFTLAASELNVTPGAIGQQIQKLEEWLGVALFVRQIRQVTPTPEGRAYYAQIQPALAQIVHASRRMRERQGKGVTLSVPPGFAAKWFAPRMADFLKAHPGVALNLTTSTAFVDFELDGIDLAIRHFDGNAPGLSVHKLGDDEARLYCSPAYAREHGISKPEDLHRATLLHNTLHPHWLAWLTRYSRLTDVQIESIAGIQFDQSLIAIEAAVRGQGVVLTSAMLTEGERASGSLVEPFRHALPLPTAYYVVHPASAGLQPSARALKEWLLATSAARGK